jgi:hypothetical protein
MLRYLQEITSNDAKFVKAMSVVGGLACVVTVVLMAVVTLSTST